MSLRIKVWGCRGSIACPSPTHLRYGGNTTSLEVDAGEKKFLLDCGTGVRNLGQELMKNGTREGFLLLTHTHWDHINGFPFFRPAFEADRQYHILAGHLYDKQGIKAVFETQMDNPMFPVPLDAMKAQLLFEDFEAGDSLDLGQGEGLRVKTCKLNHPNDATGYRIEHGGKAFCLITDTEHVPGQPDQNILNLIEGADLVLYDSTYTEEEFPSKIGWGHSTWEEGVKLCKAANVKRLGIFHHDPEHDDDFMDKLSSAAESAWSKAFVVREQMELIVE